MKAESKRTGYTILTVAIRYEQDVVLARQRARQIAGLLGFEHHDQVRIATAVSEIARNAFQYGANGKVEFSYEAAPAPVLQIRITDEGRGIADLARILEGRYRSNTGMGLGILGARRLMDDFDINSAPGQGTRVALAKRLPKSLRPLSVGELAERTRQLAKEVTYEPFTELQQQNQELLATLDELNTRQAQLAAVNKELEDTNRGVVALYAELEERADTLRHTADLKTQFLSNMSHEFRTPLNSILSLAHILQEQLDGVLNEEQLRQVDFIEKAAAGLSEIVNDMLDLARVEAGKVQVRPSEFTITDLFGALRGMLRPLLASNSVQLIFDEPASIPPLSTDESKVSQILRNFISNALKFTERGEVRVSAHLRTDEQVSISVSDTGIGIAQEDQGRIFEDYVQVEGPHQKGKQGTGLGLPLSKRLAHLLGGSLSVQSAPGKGSTFTVTIPLVYNGPSDANYAPEIVREVDPTRLPVLIIEDNRETQFIYEKFLKGTGFQAIPVRSLGEARQALTQFRPAAIILDVLLRNENTWGFLTGLKRDPQTSAIPVYVITMVENEQKAIALGADDFFTKPVDRIWLLNKLRGLEGAHRRRELLIIDDEEISRYLLKGHLSDTFSRIVEASSGAEGLRLAGERRPAAVFLDLIMPDMDGFEVLRRLKDDPATAQIPVIVYSNKHLTAAEEALLSKETAAIIPKNPAERERTLQQIRRTLVEAGVMARAATEEHNEQ